MVSPGGRAALLFIYTQTKGRVKVGAALEATQGQMDGFFSPLPYECHLEEMASVGDLTYELPSTRLQDGIWWADNFVARIQVRGYLAQKKHPPPSDHHRSRGIGATVGFYGEKGGGFL